MGQLSSLLLLSVFNFSASCTKAFGNNASSVTYDLLKSKIVSLNINYEDLSYTCTSEDPKMEIIDLIGSIGGTLGIF